MTNSIKATPKDSSLELDIQIKTNIGSVTELNQIYNSINNQLLTEENLTKLLKSDLEKLFQKHKTVTRIFWNQYTPYFNDGEPCTFRGPYEIAVEFDDGVIVSENEEYNWTEEQQTIADEFSFIVNLDDEFLLTMFGDHAEITITPDMDITVEEYNHD